MKADAVAEAQLHRGAARAGLRGRLRARHHGRGHRHFMKETTDDQSTLTRSSEISNR